MEGGGAGSFLALDSHESSPLSDCISKTFDKLGLVLNYFGQKVRLSTTCGRWMDSQENRPRRLCFGWCFYLLEQPGKTTRHYFHHSSVHSGRLTAIFWCDYQTCLIAMLQRRTRKSWPLNSQNAGVFRNGSYTPVDATGCDPLEHLFIQERSVWS